jgi:predicted nucleic-acid-binding Zn-ribbon protein
MENYIICPCCGNKIRVLFEGGKLSVFFDAENQDKLQEILSSNCIELGIVKGGEMIE